MAEQNENKTFTQEDVNAIIKTRLKEDRAGREAEFAKREADITRREFMQQVNAKAAEEDIPADIVAVLNITDDESMAKAFAAVKPLIDISKQPIMNPVGPTKNETGGADSALRTAFFGKG
jgi:hypothetical protein